MRKFLNYSVFGLMVIMVALSFSVSALEETITLDDYEVTYSYSESQATQGERFNIDVTITNTASQPKNNVRFSLDGDSDLDVDNDDWDIGILAAGASVKKSFRIDVDDSASSGRHSLDFEVRDSSDSEEDSIDVEIESDSPELIIGDIQSSPSLVSPDTKDITLNIQIQNIGGGDATFIRAQLILPQGFESAGSFSDNVNLGTIAKDQSKTASFKVNSLPDLASGISKASIKLEYKDGTEVESITLPFDIPVEGRPQFSLIDSRTMKFSAGQKDATLNIKVANSGEEEGKETSIRVFENADLPISFDEKTKTIGSLLPGEQASATFKFDVDDDALPGDYIVKVQVRTVQNDNVLVSEEKVQLTIDKSKKTFPWTYVILGVLLLLIIIFLIVFALRRRPTDDLD